MRERKDDIVPIATHCINIFNKEFKKNLKSISPEAQELLLSYPWYGNIRELKNVMERICLLENTDVIYPEHIPPEITDYKETVSGEQASLDIPAEGLSLKGVERELVVKALENTKGNSMI